MYYADMLLFYISAVLFLRSADNIYSYIHF